MATSLSVNPSRGSTITFTSQVTITATLSNGTVYMGAFDYYTPTFKFYDANGNLIGAKNIPTSCLSGYGNTLTITFVPSELLGASVTPVKLVIQGTVPYDYTGNGWYAIYFDGTQDASGAEYYLNLITPVLGKPGNPVVSISGNNFVLNWPPASASGGSGSVTYAVLYGTADHGWAESIARIGASTTTTIPIWSYEVECGFTIVAYYSG